MTCVPPISTRQTVLEPPRNRLTRSFTVIDLSLLPPIRLIQHVVGSSASHFTAVLYEDAHASIN